MIRCFPIRSIAFSACCLMPVAALLAAALPEPIGSDASSLSALHDNQSKFVQVDGRSYRVIVKNGAVMVHNKAAAYRFTMEERDRQREAVRLATGCEPTDDFDSVAAGRLKAKLECKAVK